MKYLLILLILLVSCSTHPRLFSNEGSLILKKKINRLIVSSDLGATMGISIVSLKTGKPIYELNSEKLLMPASNNKLFTCAAALDFLGKDFFFLQMYSHKMIMLFYKVEEIQTLPLKILIP